MSIISELRENIDTSTSWGKLEYTNWRDENLSWKHACYIGDWSYLDEFRISGPDALRFLSEHTVNSVAKFDIGQAKHAIFCNHAGKVIGEGVLTRHAAEEFEFNARGPVVNWLEYRLGKGNYAASAATTIGHFKFQVSGPTALAVCEKLAGQSLRDIKFMRYRTERIGGCDVTFLRQGMAGEIGFELHGPSKHAEEVRNAILHIGREFGIRQLGSRTAMVNHLEAAFPTVTHDYLPAVGDEPERDFFDIYSRVVPQPGSQEWFKSFARSMKVKGSFEGTELSDWYRSPVELGWARNVNFDHEFYGRAALEREVADPKRARVTLIWNKDDVNAVYASLFEEGDPYDYMEMPRHQWNCMYANKVMDGKKLVGVATSRGYSYYFRKMLSHCVIDLPYASVGTQVSVVWGDPDTRQKLIRATVAPSPFKVDNRRSDLGALP
jgi:vanillate/3-O-methylgallate O-demethylase